MFYWDELLDCIALNRSVVPIIGSDLLTITGKDGAPVAFHTCLAQRCAALLKQERLDVADDAPLSMQMKLALQKDIDFAPALYAAHQALLTDLFATGTQPVPLRLLTQIQNFPFFVTTTTDGLLAATLGLQDEEIVAAQIGQSIDLPLGWQSGQPPRLFYLFGRIAAGSDPAVTEEDTLEFLAHLHDKGRPVRLLAHLRQSHLLFLGNSFPDWLARVFLRFVRDERFCGGKKIPFDAMVAPETRGGTGLVSFLKAYSPKTRVYEDGDSMQFVRTLHEKWLEREKSKVTKIAVVSGEGNTEPAPMEEAAIFISYASENHAAAEALAAALSSQHLAVWLDRRRLQGGDKFSHKIEENIRRCRLFVPLISKETAARREGWFRREWLRCRERLEMMDPGLTFVVPVTIDDVKDSGGSDVAFYFTLAGQSPHILHCLGGRPSPERLQEFVQIFRRTTRLAACV